MEKSEIKHFKGKDFIQQRSNWEGDVKSNQNKMKRQEESVRLDDQDEQKDKIIQIYYSLHHGYFFLLTNGSICAYFNDGELRSFYQKQQQKIDKRDQLIQFVQKNIFKNNPTKQTLKKQEKVYIFKVLQIKDGIIVRLSNHTIQAFFGQVINGRFSREVILNYSQKNPNKICVKCDKKQYTFENYSQCTTSQQAIPAVEYIRRIFSQILKNSQIKLQTPKNRYQKIQNLCQSK